MTFEEAREKWSNCNKKDNPKESNPHENILGYFIAPIDRAKFYKYLKSFWELDSTSMVELFKSNGDLQSQLEQEDVDVFCFRGKYWITLRQWNEENDKDSYTIYDIPQEVCPGIPPKNQIKA